jgi:hypothetical protein
MNIIREFFFYFYVHYFETAPFTVRYTVLSEKANFPTVNSKGSFRAREKGPKMQRIFILPLMSSNKHHLDNFLGKKDNHGKFA